MPLVKRNHQIWHYFMQLFWRYLLNKITFSQSFNTLRNSISGYRFIKETTIIFTYSIISQILSVECGNTVYIFYWLNCIQQYSQWYICVVVAIFFYTKCCIYSTKSLTTCHILSLRLLNGIIEKSKRAF